MHAGGYSINFHFGICVQSERAENRGLKNGLLPKLESKKTHFFLSNLRLLEQKFDHILGFRTEDFEKSVKWGHSFKLGSYGTEKEA